MVRTTRALLALLCALAPGAASLARETVEPAPRPAVTAAELIEHIRRLASEEWEGRGSGTQGEKAATDYIAAHFERLGCEPAGVDGGWFQPVPVGANVTIEEGGRFEVALDGEKRLELKQGEDFVPFSASAAASVEAEAIFCGYGVTAPNLGYDDYAGVDVKGKIVVVLRHLPHAKGRWENRRVVFRHATFAGKLRQAQRRGAAALVVVNDPHRHQKSDELQTGGIGRLKADIPFIHVSLAAGGRLLETLFQATPKALEDAIHAGEAAAPSSRPGRGRVSLTARLTREPVEGRNVCGLLRAGAQNALDEFVVVGAHHDHLGRGRSGGSLGGRAAAGEIHNGADDNASGTAGLLEAATYLASRREELRRSILFITFTGEERGLLGSQWYCNHPTHPLSKTVAMLNMDMIGRLGKRELFIGGTGTSPALPPILKKRVAEAELKVQYGEGGQAPSDNTSFYRKQLPVLFFYTGGHKDYHRPSDDWQKIDQTGIEKVARLASRVCFDVANLEERPAFTRADRGGMPGRRGPFIGIRPADAEGGVGVGAVTPQGPAQKAGIQGGDVILSIGGNPTPDLGALRGALARQKAGKEVVVEVRRGEKTLEIEVKLGGS